MVRITLLVSVLFLSGMLLSCPAGRELEDSTGTLTQRAPSGTAAPTLEQLLGIESFEKVQLFRDRIYQQALRGRVKMTAPEDILDSGDFRFHDPVVPTHKLTVKERMLLYGWWDTFDGERQFVVPIDTVNLSLLRDKQDGIPYSKTMGEMLIRKLGKQRYDELQDLETASRRSRGVYRDYLSPITGKPIEIDRKEFSPGNAFFRVIDDPKVLSSIKAHLERSNNRFAKIADKVIFVYKRVYGEQGIIKEGYSILGGPEFVSEEDFWGMKTPPFRSPVRY